MSGKRLNKRQLREQQELEELVQVGGTSRPSKARDEASSSLLDVADEAESGGERAGVTTTSQSLFAQLEDGSEDGEEDANGDDDGKDDISTATAVRSRSKSKKKKKKNKAGVATSMGEAEGKMATVSEPTETAAQKPAGKKRANRKGARSTAAQKGVSDLSMDELSELLASQAELDQAKSNEADGSSATATVTPIGPLSTLRAHLTLSAPALDPAVELKRQFGAAAIKAYEAEAGSAGGGGSSASSGARARAQAWNPNLKVRNILVQPKETWPPIARTFTGMSMEVYDAPGRSKTGGWVHSKAYRSAQFDFLQAVRSYEPNHLMALLRRYPWHIDTLLQLSDVSRHQGDLGQASDFNARALFAFERTAAPIFTSSLTSHLGPPMLNFERIEDRGFWLASHRHVNFMGRRGTWRTALEWVKLILGLDPTSDKHGMLLWLDFLSIKSRQHVWFLDCLRKLDSAVGRAMDEESVPILAAKTPFDEADKPLAEEDKEYRGSLDWYAGLSYAKALALRAVEREAGVEKAEMKKSTAALRLAIARHPYVLPGLLEKIGVPMPKGITSTHPLFSADDDADTMPQLLTHVYVSRSESLWRETGVSAWLTSTLEEAWPELQSAFDRSALQRASATWDEARQSIYRHVLVSDLPDALRQTLVGLMPRDITSESAMLNAFDPLPPQGTNVTSYNDDYFNAELSGRYDGEDNALDGQQAAGMMDALMRTLRGIRMPPGWRAAMEQMDEESQADLVAQFMDLAAQGQQAGMPGALAAEDGELDDDDVGPLEIEDEDAGIAEGGQPATGGAFGALGGFLDRVWGQRRRDRSQSEEQAVEEAAVDEDGPSRA